MQAVGSLDKGSRRLTPQAFPQITICQFEADLSVIGIEVRNLVENVERFPILTGPSVCVGDYEILGPRINHETLGGVKIGELESDVWISRLQALDLFVHR